MEPTPPAAPLTSKDAPLSPSRTPSRSNSSSQAVMPVSYTHLDVYKRQVLEKDGPVHEAFLREYLGGTDDDLQNYYRALVFLSLIHI